jgi:parallel beta-helix repeat protein
MKSKCLFITLALRSGLTLALLWLLGGGSPVIQAQGPDGYSTYYVAPSCTGVPDPCYTRVQAAVDAADDPDDVIKVATGTYTDANYYIRGHTQVVYINKSVTIRGGYTTTNWATSDPEANPTTLDAQGQGRVLYISVAGVGEVITPMIEGLRITGGYIQPVQPWGAWGGGMYINATATISNNRVFSNTASFGGGMFLRSRAATLCGNTVTSNTADFGGGLFLDVSVATLSGNTVSANTATTCGGGLCMDLSDATLSGNTVSGNTAYRCGGGLYLRESDATLSGNTVSGNTVSGDNTAYRCGGGLYLRESDATLINTVVADNQAPTGGGLWLEDSSPRLLHTTIARNGGGDGSGVYVTDAWGTYSSVALTNTILVSHTVGIYVSSGNTATLEATLWGTDTWANEADWGGDGTVINGTVNLWDDPDFVDPGAGDYHIGPGSAAIDTGVDAGVTTDIHGQARDANPDLGADECDVTCFARWDDEQGSRTGACVWYTDYVEDALACYYGEPVDVDIVNGQCTFEWQVKNGSVKEELVFEGTATIYAGDEVIDKRPMRGIEWFLDMGGDAVCRSYDGGPFWITRRDSPDLEKLKGTYKIEGVYEERWLNDHGAFRECWTSGDCSGP